MPEQRMHPEMLREIEKGERGKNTEVIFTFVRHSQKNSGAVMEGTKISSSGISAAGIERAKKYGKDTMADRSLNKGYATSVDRTKETLEAALTAAGVEANIRQEAAGEPGAYFALPAMSGSDEFMQKYNGIFSAKKDEYVREHFGEAEFSELTPDQQEAAAEYAEEDALQMYLNYDNERPDEGTLSPREQANMVAHKINRLVNLPDFMEKDKSVELVSVGHKTSTEAFLKYVIEQQGKNEDEGAKVGFDSLEEIGGSLKILDSWDLDVKNDEKGNKTAEITIRRENGETTKYTLNQEALATLAKEYIEANDGVKAKKIDEVA